MNVLSLLPSSFLSFAAAEGGDSFQRTFELSWPESTWGIFLLVVGVPLLITYIVWLYLKDTQEFSPFWRTWLLGLRLLTVLALVIIALNPHERTERTSYRPSRVAILVDTSGSMEKPFRSLKQGETIESIDTRSEAVRKLMTDSDLIKELQKQHEVSVFTFDAQLKGNQQTYPSLDSRMKQIAGIDEEDNKKEPLDSKQWKAILAPQGTETRLGDSLSDWITQNSGPTLSGVVLLTDGQLTAGIDASSVNQKLKDNKVRLIAVGIGGTDPEVNVSVINIAAPAKVQVGDPFDIEANVTGQGVKGKPLMVELYSKLPGEAEAALLESQELILTEDNTPAKVVFTRTPDTKMESMYTVKVKPPTSVHEGTIHDNAKSKNVVATDEPTKILLIAGTPKRDYRFLRDVLIRNSGIKLDIWLQGADEGISQGQGQSENVELLSEFPDTKAELFEYDVMITFDADWDLITEESQKQIEEWVFKQGGGLIFVAGELYTPAIASQTDQFESIRLLLPVELDSLLLDLRTRSGNDASQPWKVQFTADGKQKPFFSITEDSVSSQVVWDEFPGVYRVYPTVGAKNSTVYAYHGDTRLEDTNRIFLAGQACSKGFSVYVGSAEMYRLRSFDDEYFERFWVSMIRDLAKLRYGQNTRAEFMSLPRTAPLGQEINLRVRLSNQEFKPLQADFAEVTLVKPDGSTIVPALKLKRDPKREGEFIGAFRPPTSGQYRVQILVPDTDEMQQKTIEVKNSQSEQVNTIQNIKLLRDLVLDTGSYLPFENLESELPVMLKSKGEEFRISEQIRTLWDKQWVMLLLIALLSVEWLSRKLLQLA